MSPERLTVAVLAVLALLALAAGAASLADPVSVGGFDPSADEPNPSRGDNESWDVSLPEIEPFDIQLGDPPPLCIGPLYEAGPMGVVLFTVALAGVTWYIASATAALAVGVGGGPFFLLLYGLLTIGCRNPELEEPPQEPEAGGTGSDVVDSALGTGASPERVVDLASDPFLVLVALALVGVVGAIVALRGFDREDESPTEAPPEAEVEAAELARIAGETADRLDAAATGDLDNEVFRAWREMTGLLDVADPSTATPGDFAAAAEEAGLAPGDVRALTALFEAVRYGDRPATPEREAEAVETLRRIERAYGGEP
ncbi:MAG: DUF4129 domain-containing protein [Halobacteriales archaeon]